MTAVVYFIYKLALAIGSPLVVFYLLLRGLKDTRYFSTLPERLGFLPRLARSDGGSIWLHAVSVGEVTACLPLFHGLRREFRGTPLFLTVSTLAGYRVAVQKLGAVADAILYAPLDYSWIVRRFLRLLRPQVLLVAETEIWPNLLREAARARCAVLLVNGRISDRALPRYLRMRWFFRQVLPHAEVLAQSEEMARRFRDAGAPAGKVSVMGNVKYDFEPSGAPLAPPLAAVLSTPGARIWIAASTMPPAEAGDPDEDAAVIGAFLQLRSRHRDLLLVLAPRKPERFDAAAKLLSGAEIPFLRRSQLRDGGALLLPGVLLLDSIGELSAVFPLARAVFMGGTLVRRGGHNILEPALCGVPVITGPHMENFPEIIASFRANSAVDEIAGASQLAASVNRLLDDPERARGLGERGKVLAESQRGATELALGRIRECYGDSLPRILRPLPVRMLLRPFALLWYLGAKANGRDRYRRRMRLAVPVVSVGNISMGGTGKTPVAVWLAVRLGAGVLLRGYKRDESAELLAIPAGAVEPVAKTGDEAQIYIRARIPVGVGASRIETGRMLADAYGVPVLILDDGFQHRQVERQVDLVLLDAADPMGRWAPVPLGRLRETPSALGRASIVLITRAPCRMPALERRIQRANRFLPVFYSRFVPDAWLRVRDGALISLETKLPGPIGAFCGLAKPESFQASLRELGIRPDHFVAFEDHHRYRSADLYELSSCRTLLTTEKDAVKLSGIQAAFPGDILWLRTRLQIEGEAEFLSEIERQLRAAR